ncbi:carbonic anhydrase [Lentinula aciculospora]|uniref:Carbonic anhydrase n=1 Tax=Lentinula aciculospora TaxID=153920 RepID=A0A9W9A588_9AGAR|nr:carbonic anhydrase [Lentinula aciculospora]
MPHHSAIAQMLSGVDEMDPGFFHNSQQGQRPHTLWIGCGDSRVPETVISGAKPGDILVNRNIGNQVRFDDDSMLAVLTFAVEVLGVEHVIVCGHTGCGAVEASFNASKSKSFTPTQPHNTFPGYPAESSLNRWLASLAILITSLRVSSVPDDEALSFLVRENVKVQVDNLCQTEVIKNVWKNGGSPQGKEVWVHGWVYDIGLGRIRDLEISRGPEPTEKAL